MSVDVAVSAAAPKPPRQGDGWGVRSVRGVGWLFIAAGTLVLLFLVYLLWFTDVRGAQAQRELASQFSLTFGDVDSAVLADADPGEPVTEPAPVEIGDAYAALWFERDGVQILHDAPLYVVEGTDLGSLRHGPGHYLDTADPGQVGNLAIAGHRTTNSRPFYNLDRLVVGDTVHVVDRDLREWVYEIRASDRGVPLSDTAAGVLVNPGDVWVVGDDPLGDGGAILTLTTCHPRFSNAQRLIVFAQLVGASDGQAAEGDGGSTELSGEG